jgi:tetratricopeptide (TPR) repeat protein
MTPSDELFQLIQSLDKKEKAYFKRYAEQGTDLVRLFDLIAGQKEYREELIRNEFRKGSFAPLKNYLFHSILQSLSRLYSDATVENELQFRIQEVDLLLRKGLRKAAYKLIRKVKAVALDHNLFLFAVQAINFERTIARTYEKGQFEEAMNRLQKEEAHCWLSYQNLSAYIDLDSRLFHIRSTIVIPRTRKEIQLFADMLKHPLLRSENKALSFEARYYFHRLNGTCSQIIGQHEKSLLHRRRLVSLFESLEQPNEIQVLKHSSALYELAISLRSQGYADEALNSVHDIMSLGEKFPGFMTVKNKSVLFKRFAVLQTDFLQYFGHFEEGLGQIGLIEKGLKQYAAFIEKDLSLITRYNMALILFGAGELRKALRLLNDIINENEKNFATDVVSFSHILRLIIYIDLGRDELVETMHASVVNQLEKRKRLYKAEEIFLDFVINYVKMDKEQKRRELCDEMAKQFEQLFRDPIEKNAEEYFHFISWFRARAQKRNFAELYRERTGTNSRV